MRLSLFVSHSTTGIVSQDASGKIRSPWHHAAVHHFDDLLRPLTDRGEVFVVLPAN